MGRTLHFKVVNPEEISEEEKQEMINVSEKMQKYEWECESFYLDPYQYNINWGSEAVKELGKQSALNISQIVGNMLKTLQEDEKMSRGGAVKHVAQIGWILCDPNNIGGFCKVAGSEQNAMLVYMALVVISKLTKAKITLSDEGDYLKVPVIIKNGKARINLEALKKDWGYWEKQGMLKDNTYGVADKKLAQEALIAKYPRYTDPENLAIIL